MASQKFGRYQVKRPLGQGGMAVVYLAYDPMMKREVAVKILPTHLTTNSQLLSRFHREVETIAQLEHSCIVPVYDYGEEDGQPYIVMRYMAGGSLLSRLAKGPLNLTELLPVIERVATALDKAHAHGIIHRDLKPGNILFDDQGQAYLSDFGIAKVVEAATSYTGSAIVGTPMYMSPEQGSGSKNLDGRSDVYALGIIAFEALTGQLPYQADTPIAVLVKHITADIPSLLEINPDLPLDLEIVIRQALAKTPDRRYAAAGDLAADLAAADRGEALSPRPELQGPNTELVTELSGLKKEQLQLPSNSDKVSPTGARDWRKQWLFLISAAVGLLAVGGMAGALLTRESQSTPTAKPTVLSVVEANPTATLPWTPTPIPTTPTVLPTETSTPRPSMAGVVKRDPTQLFDGPGDAHSSIGLLKPGLNVALLGRNVQGNWLKVQGENGLAGWVAAEQLEVYMSILNLPVVAENPTALSPQPRPTETPTNTVTVPTPTAPPTALPTFTPMPQVGLLIDDFEGYGGSVPVNDFVINRNAGNEGQLSLVGSPYVGQGQQALAFEYDIRNPSPNHYIGFDREFPAQDWTGYASLCLWIEDDGSNRNLVVQFGESKYKFWKNVISFSELGSEDHCVSLQGDHQLDLRGIGYYGIYVEGPPPGQGVIYIDSIRVVN